MKFVFAPDSFKGSISSKELNEMLRDAAQKYFPQAEAVGVPIADGGEGTIEAMRASIGGELVPVTVCDPLLRPVKTSYLKAGGAVVIECASAIGYPLLNKDEKDPLKASSYGVGEMVRHAAEKGARHIMLGLGGSVTNDGGLGFLQALGVRFYDAAGKPILGHGAKELIKVKMVDLSPAKELLIGVRLTAICDVDNPLTGERGATYVFGPQKGVTDDIINEIEQGMCSYVKVLESATGHYISTIPGAGAAGGLGAAVAGALGGRIMHGIDIVLGMADFDAKLKNASLVITGEGRLDGQSVVFGKAPVGVARKAAREGVPVIVLTGGFTIEGEQLLKEGNISIFPLVPGPITVDEAVKKGKEYALSAVDRLFRILKMSSQLK